MGPQTIGNHHRTAIRRLGCVHTNGSLTSFIQTKVKNKNHI